MKNYALLTDVTCDLTAGLYDELGIVCIPMGFLFGETEYTHYPDAREMPLATFYERLRNGEMPSTAQINPYTYRTYLEAPLKEGRDVLYLCFSSGLSGTYMTARMVAQELEEDYPDRRIVVIDTLSASVAEGWIIARAGELYKSGASMDEVIAKVRHDMSACSPWFTVENLMHLKRGGRLSSFEAVIGSALKIQPILTIDGEGKLAVVSKERGTKNALLYLIRQLREKAVKPEEQTVFIAHADCADKAELLRNMIVDAGLVKEVRTYEIGPIIGAHVGNGMCALVFEGAADEA
ncbi:MAG: DegV family protein [Lachnospiraceae bacterium]|nr:DegV family protein [Lachnospiraceae bacterium]